MRYFKCGYSNGYSCDEEEWYIALPDDEKAIEAARQDMQEGLTDYADSHVNGVEGYDMDEGWEDEDAEADYYDGCEWYMEEVSVEEYVENVEEE